MKILTFSKKDFINFMQYNNIDDSNVESHDMLFISINRHYRPYRKDSFKHDVECYFKRQHSNAITMHFGDYSEEDIQKKENKGPTGIFNEYKAKKLYEFIKKNKHKKLAIIHCGAGISRSGAIATFIFDLYGDTKYDEFKRKNPQIQPNQHILKLLRKEYDKDDTNK